MNDAMVARILEHLDSEKVTPEFKRRLQELDVNSLESQAEEIEKLSAGIQRLRDNYKDRAPSLGALADSRAHRRADILKKMESAMIAATAAPSRSSESVVRLDESTKTKATADAMLIAQKMVAASLDRGTVVIRLSRGVENRRPIYSIVVADKRFRRDGRFIEKLGYYSPGNGRFGSVKIAYDRFAYWLDHGAAVSSAVSGLIRRMPEMKRQKVA